MTVWSALKPSPQSLRRHAVSLSISRKGNAELRPSIHRPVIAEFTRTRFNGPHKFFILVFRLMLARMKFTMCVFSQLLLLFHSRPFLCHAREILSELFLTFSCRNLHTLQERGFSEWATNVSDLCSCRLVTRTDQTSSSVTIAIISYSFLEYKCDYSCPSLYNSNYSCPSLYNSNYSCPSLYNSNYSCPSLYNSNYICASLYNSNCSSLSVAKCNHSFSSLFNFDCICSSLSKCAYSCLSLCKCDFRPTLSVNINFGIFLISGRLASLFIYRIFR